MRRLPFVVVVCAGAVGQGPGYRADLLPPRSGIGADLVQPAAVLLPRECLAAAPAPDRDQRYHGHRGGTRYHPHACPFGRTPSSPNVDVIVDRVDAAPLRDPSTRFPSLTILPSGGKGRSTHLSRLQARPAPSGRSTSITAGARGFHSRCVPTHRPEQPMADRVRNHRKHVANPSNEGKTTRASSGARHIVRRGSVRRLRTRGNGVRHRLSMSVRGMVG
jgi:hypothetical protein